MTHTPHQAAALNYQRTRKAAGLCRQCGKPAVRGMALCLFDRTRIALKRQGFKDTGASVVAGYMCRMVDAALGIGSVPRRPKWIARWSKVKQEKFIMWSGNWILKQAARIERDKAKEKP